MTPDVKYCFEDEDLEQVARNMGDIPPLSPPGPREMPPPVA